MFMYMYMYIYMYIYVFIDEGINQIPAIPCRQFQWALWQKAMKDQYVLLKSVTRDTGPKTKVSFPRDQSTKKYIFIFHSDVSVHYVMSALNGFCSGCIYHSKNIIAKHSVHTIISRPSPKQLSYNIPSSLMILIV